jgi:hypothetical protein
MLRNGFYIFSYRVIEHWERSLLIENAYYNTNHTLLTKPNLIKVVQRRYNSMIADKEFKPICVKDWYVYECNKNVYQIYPREYKWLDIEIPNKISHATYIPDIVNTGDTLVFDAEQEPEAKQEQTPRHLN